MGEELGDVDDRVELDADIAAAHPDDPAGDRFARLEFDRDLRPGPQLRIDMRLKAAGGDVADQAQFAAAIDDQGSDPQNPDVALVLPPLGRRGDGVRERESRLHQPFTVKHFARLSNRFGTFDLAEL